MRKRAEYLRESHEKKQKKRARKAPRRKQTRQLAAATALTDRGPLALNAFWGCMWRR